MLGIMGMIWMILDMLNWALGLVTLVSCFSPVPDQLTNPAHLSTDMRWGYYFLKYLTSKDQQWEYDGSGDIFNQQRVYLFNQQWDILGRFNQQWDMHVYSS